MTKRHYKYVTNVDLVVTALQSNFLYLRHDNSILAHNQFIAHINPLHYRYKYIK